MAIRTTKKKKERDYQQRNAVIERTIVIGAGMVTALFVWFFGFRPFLVNGISMYPTFNASFVGKKGGWSPLSGDYLVIDAFSYRFLEDPERLDVIVAKSPIEPGRHLLKRIIGLPNERISVSRNTITITTPDGQTMVLDEPYINQEEQASYKDTVVQLGDNQYFLLGDNRTNSLDSRVWGALTKDRIVGRVILRLYPLDEVEVRPGSVDRGTLNVL